MVDEPQSVETDEQEKWPFTFILTVVLVVLYLGWRLIQGIGWVIDKL